MKKLTKLTALLLAGLLSASLLLACNDGFDYTEEDEDEDDEKVTTTASATTTEVTTTTTADPVPEVTDKEEQKPTTNAPVVEINPTEKQPDPMPSEIYHQLATAENASMNADISEKTWYCHLVKDGDLAEYYEYNYGTEETFTIYYNLATQTVYYEDEGKWYATKDETVGTFADLMEEYGFGADSIFFNDDNFDHYDSSFGRFELKESLLDPQNGLLWGKMSYPSPGNPSTDYNFQCQRVDQASEIYGFTVNSQYPIMLPNEFEWID